ncbi:Uncharacterised protein [Mycobacteroides abscessus subsp. abscessus]|nr:Uncharacterised protein [Mycobacteroides abscessus subsp. abscessus]
MACVSGAPALPATRMNPVPSCRTTVHQFARSTWGASWASTSRRADAAAAATLSISSSSRCASSRPVCGRMECTCTPFRASAAVINESGMEPGGRSMTRSSMA